MTRSRSQKAKADRATRKAVEKVVAEAKRVTEEKAVVRVTLKLKGTLRVTKELEPDVLSMAFLMTV